MNKMLNTLSFVSLFAILWTVTIVIYGLSTGNFLMGAKLGILTSLSKTGIAKIHSWGWTKLHRKVLAQ